MGLNGDQIVMLLIIGIVLFLLNYDDLIGIKSAKSWNSMNFGSKLILINGCLFILYLLYYLLSKSDTTDEKDK